jgi:hypothetical protein
MFTFVVLAAWIAPTVRIGTDHGAHFLAVRGKVQGIENAVATAARKKD